MRKIRGFEIAKGFEDKNIELPVRATVNAAGYDFKASDDIVVPSIWDSSKLADNRSIKFITKAIYGVEMTKDQIDSIKEEEILELVGLSNLENGINNFLTVITRLSEKGVDITDLEQMSSISNNDLVSIFEGIITEEDILEFERQSLKLFRPVLVSTGVKSYMGTNEMLQLANRSGNPKNGLVLANGIGVIDSDYYENKDNDGHIMFQFYNFSSEPYTIKKGDRIGQGIFLPFLKADNDFVTNERSGGFGSTGK